MTLSGFLDGLGLVLAVGSFGAGLRAALLWRRASLAPIEPAWGRFEPLDRTQAAEGGIAGALSMLSASGSLNARAAGWSAAAVAASGCQSLVSWIAAHLGA